MKSILKSWGKYISAGEENPRLLYNLRVHYRIHQWTSEPEALILKGQFEFSLVRLCLPSDLRNRMHLLLIIQTPFMYRPTHPPCSDQSGQLIFGDKF
jgi:hypothetical protein